jgi:hypothetical protein
MPVMRYLVLTTRVTTDSQVSRRGHESAPCACRSAYLTQVAFVAAARTGGMNRKCRRPGAIVVLSYGGRLIRLRPSTTWERRAPRAIRTWARASLTI